MTMCLNYERSSGGYRISRSYYSKSESVQILQDQIRELVKETEEFKRQYNGVINYYEELVKTIR